MMSTEAIAPGGSLVQRLRSIDAVATVGVTRMQGDVEDLEVMFADAGLGDVTIWHNVALGSSLVLIENARLEGVCDDDVVSLIGEVALRRFVVKHGTVEVWIAGAPRVFGGSSQSTV